MMKTGVWLGLALTGVLVMGCGASGSDESSTGPTAAAPTTASPSPSPTVQQVSDETICDLLFRDNGVMVKSVALMSKRQTTTGAARRAREYAEEAERIGTHAKGDMATKVEALTRSLRDFAESVDSPAGGFTGDDFAVAGLELGNTCDLDLPKAHDRPHDAPQRSQDPHRARPGA